VQVGGRLETEVEVKAEEEAAPKGVAVDVSVRALLFG
jgi:hypothetical protein